MFTCNNAREDFKMALYSKNNAVGSPDLFDNFSDSQPGERQMDIEEIIYEKSLYALIVAGDEVGKVDWIDQAGSGKVMRIV